VIRDRLGVRKSYYGTDYYSFIIRSKERVLLIAKELEKRCITKRAVLLQAITWIEAHPNKSWNGDRPRWTREQIAILTNNADKLDVYQIAELTGRSPKAVYTRAERLFGQYGRVKRP